MDTLCQGTSAALGMRFSLEPHKKVLKTSKGLIWRTELSYVQHFTCAGLAQPLFPIFIEVTYF